jgi:hypothetical protein
MAGAADEARPVEAAGGKAQEVGRAENADVGVGKGLKVRAHRQQGALQAVAHEQQGDAEQQRGDRGKGFGHRGAVPVERRN